MSRLLSRVVARAVLLTAFTSAVAVGQVTRSVDVEAGRYDNGKMWTFDYPPVEHIRETYGFAPDEAWFEKARLGALRLPNCTASFVSPYGLVMTNHHCARGSVAQVSGPDENLLELGFTSASLEAERPVPGLYVDQLIALEDVTEEVYDALAGLETDAEKASARRDAIARITARVSEAAGGIESGIVVQVINLYNGGRYSAYTFRRYSDVRLVMAPELQLGYFGGDTDNFTFPRYALDMSFLRVYRDGAPFRPEHYFEWSEEGSREGDPVFVIGNPGSTNRLETVAQLEWRRDVQEKYLLELLNSRIALLMEHYEEKPSPALLNQIFGLRNTQKLYTGRVKGLNDPVIMARRADTQRDFTEDLAERFSETSSVDLPSPYFDIIDRLEDIQAEKREFAAEYGAFLAMQPGGPLASATMSRALLTSAWLARREAGASEESLGELVTQIAGITQDVGIDRRFFEARLEDFRGYLGSDDPGVVQSLSGRSIADVVGEVFANSALADTASAREALESGRLTADDPAVAVFAPFYERWRDFQSAFAGLAAREQELNAQHGRARFEVYGTSRPPDATFSLRIADGVVSSYEYNGTLAPAYTTYFGLYDRSESHREDRDGTGEWRLPTRWQQPPATFDLSTPLNFVTTNDIIGGNSGSPILNADLEVVGLIFDGNIESLPSAFIYQTEGARAVGVDVRGMREALDDIYDMDRIVYELMESELVETEAAADAVAGQ